MEIKFADLKAQPVGDAIVGWLALGDAQSALKEFEKLDTDAAASEAGLHCRYKIAVALNDGETAARVLAKAIEEHPNASWAVLLAASVSALNGNEDFAIGLLKARHVPALEDWTICGMMAHTVAEKVPDRARGYFATAVNLCPEHHREFLVDSALSYPPLAAAIQNNKN